MGLTLLLLGGLVVLSRGFEAGAVGATLGAPLLTWLFVGLWARGSARRWPWWRYALSVILVWFGLRLVSLFGAHSQVGNGS